MATVSSKGVPVTVQVANIGGISETKVEIPPGVTILSGRNATNRTSLLRALMAAMGSDNVSLKGSAEEGRVELTLGSESYHRTLTRTNGSIRLDGDPYLDDSTVAELFAFLLESNEARRSVSRSQDLREVIMRPVDTEEIQQEIARLERERNDIDNQLDKINDLKEKLPELEQQKQHYATKIEKKSSKLEEIEEEIEAADADVEETKEEKQELESRLDHLRNIRSNLKSVRSNIERQEKSLDSLRSERADLQDELDNLPHSPMDDYSQIEEQISDLRSQKQDLETRVTRLQNVIQFNEDMFDGDETIVGSAIQSEREPENLTDQLVADETVVCWTCGSEVNTEAIEETLDTIRSVRSDYAEQIREIKDELETLQSEKDERESQQQRREKIERELTDIADEIDRRETELEELREQRDELSDEVETVEAEVEALESDTVSDILELHKKANQIEFELGRLESDLDDVTDQINDIEEQLAEEERLEERRDELQAALEEQRTKIKQIEQEAIEKFNNRMDEVLELLGYENLARIWIERVQKTVREGRQKVEKSKFELHVVRKTDTGTTYEDTIDHLSESEREVTGLVFALAGYLVHDVHEVVPFMLLDSLEAIDSERLADLVAYFADDVQYLIVALLPEDAAALSDEYTYISEI